MSKIIPDIIEDWINKINLVQPIESIIDNGDGTATVNTCNTWWSVECGMINIGNENYKIHSIVRNESITVEGLPIGNYFSLDIPFFIHGTIKQTDIERQLWRENGTEVTPFIYLYEPINERFNESSNPIERAVDLRLAVLANYKQDQLTDDIYNYSVLAMRSLAEMFIMVVQNQIKQVDIWSVTYDIRNYAKHGVSIVNGSEKNIFSENLSGVELNLTLPLKKEKKCVYLCNN